MNAAEAVRVAGDFELKTLVPIHYEGWKHFRQGSAELERAFRQAGIEDRVRWLPTGKPLTLEV
jgi:L-ascorbate metabolism protein UlaG (beta-lactamase superfamily)